MKRPSQTIRLPGGQVVATQHADHDQSSHGNRGGGGDKGPSDREYLPGKSEKGFSEYMEKVDKNLKAVTGGMTSGDLNDVTYRDFYDTGKSPAYAAKRAMRESGFRPRPTATTERMRANIQGQRDSFMAKIGMTREQIRALPADKRNKLQDDFRAWIKTPEGRAAYKSKKGA